MAQARNAPRQDRSIRTIDSIVDAAARLLGERGQLLTTNAVAEAAGVSIGSLYRYFPDKGALIEAVRQRHRDDLLPVLQVGRGQVAAFVDGMIEVHRRNPAAQRVLLEDGRCEAECRRAYEALFAALTRCSAEHRRIGAEVFAGAVGGALEEAARNERLASPVFRWELIALVEAYTSKPRPAKAVTIERAPQTSRANKRQPRAHLRLRKSPTQPRSSETVAAIVEAAAQVLESEGFEGFNTNAVAARAGVSIGSLYQYFPGKDALTVALIHRETQRFYDDAAIALDKRSGKAALEYLIGASVRQQLERPMLARLLDIEESRPALRDELAKVDLAGLFAAIVARAAPKHPQPEIAAGDLSAIIRGMTDAAGERGERDLERLQRRVRAAVFGYLARES